MSLPMSFAMLVCLKRHFGEVDSIQAHGVIGHELIAVIEVVTEVGRGWSRLPPKILRPTAFFPQATLDLSHGRGTGLTPN